MTIDKVKNNIEAWKKSLLDISSRNQAINFKRRKSSTVQIVYPMINDFLDKSVSSKNVSFAEMFDDLEDDEEIEKFAEESEEQIVTVYGVKLPLKEIYTKEELLPVVSNFEKKNKGNFLFSTCNNKTQRKVLRNLMKKAKTFKEENAINVLYFAVGYLEWYESKDSDEKQSAPILFMAAELSQDSFDAPFKISFSENELLLNDSLIRKLIQDYKLDFTFDLNQYDISNFEIYRKYKEFMSSKFSDKRWKIYDEIDLGIFSFSKINMVKDLEENSKRISDNPLIRKLIGDFNSIDSEKIYDEEEIDQIIDPKNYYHILDADSSQEIAIQSAISGKSFVLQGPPGTGKSQTITNIITELIARNKKVLFVAEKKAALDVVYNNLKKIGLNDYALPIHNSKLDKKVVLRELSNTLEKGQEAIEVDQKFSNDQVDKFINSKAQLIEYPKVILQKRYPINKSLYQLYGLLLKYQKHEEIQFRFNHINKVGAQDLQSIESAILSFYNANFVVQFDPKKHPLYDFKYEKLSIQEKEDLNNEIKSFSNSVNKLYISYQDVNIFKTTNTLLIRELDSYESLLNHLSTIKNIDENLYHHASINTDIELYTSLIDLEKEISSIRSKIEFFSDIEIAKLDIAKFITIANNNSYGLKRLFSNDYSLMIKQMNSYLKTTKLKYFEVLSLLKDINSYNQIIIKFNKSYNKTSYKSKNDKAENLSETLYDLIWMKKYKNFLNLFTFSLEKDHFSKIRDYFEDKENIDEKINQFRFLLKDYNDKYSNIKKHFDSSKVQFENMNALEILKYFENITNEFYRIEEILSFNKAQIECEKIGLSDYLQKIIDFKINKNYVEIFYKRFYILLVDNYLEDLLPGFTGSKLDLARGNFKDAELVIQKMAKSKVERNIIKGIPNYNGLQGYNVEVTTLRTEANKSRNILPFRVLFSKIPNLITQLKPCLMMSPLSVSTFLRSTDIEFDTVIFDEASQVKPENSIGAIFRAKQLIITGDKEQLPPTNFFQNVSEDENNVEENYDTNSFDSILEVSSSFITSIKLRWHYRSKFEDLIRPSNKEIYKNLITFPSISKPKNYEGIQFIYLNGLYTERKNEIEADQVIHVLSDIIDKFGTDKSVGVVTFNNEQQLLIERKINHFRRTNPHYESFFVNNENESFFVKNIETVQGDERDIIIVSIGYGPDRNGNISMNLGPLNQTNGYRRLNVAVTRAKTSLVLVTSIKSSDIDLNRTQSRGLKFLKQYLEFAEFGEDDKVDNIDDQADFDSPFEEDVYNELINLGYEVKKQVGSSGYRIDLAVIDPNNPSNFLVGIECDGATYHSSKSVRDRDRLRQNILEDRNWIIYRIWSTDWIKNKKTQVEKLSKFIKSIEREAKKPVSEDLPLIPIISNKKESSKIEFLKYPNYENLTKSFPIHIHSYQIQDFVLEIIENTSPIHFDELKKIVPFFWGRQKYTNLVDDMTNQILRSLSKKGDIILKEDFVLHSKNKINFRETTDNSSRREFLNIHPEELKDGILRILKITSKIKIDELFKMTIRFCGFQSSSTKIKEYFQEIINELEKSKKIKIINQDYVEEFLKNS
jgi:very-short-patch-repair endonuclease/DNA polymerase III delta prime subunit